ncbi:glycosyltransferase [Agarivorans aestuarii]|uniref:glycosyltransferase n=1 Tax=Agarivorans aestuarii TaxID=1563703 RepID=UPI001C7EDC3D|nr:glycosyltransferase [Agarivorans aestuarii]
MTIFHFITNFALTGGAEKMLANLVNNQPQHKHVIIALMQASPKNRSLIKPDSEVEFISLNAKGPVSMLLAVFKLRRLVKQRDVSLIQSWMYHANAIAGLYKLLFASKLPLFMGVHHSLDKYQDEKMSTRLALWLGKLVAHKTQQIICCSQRSVKQHIAYGYPADKMHFIANGYQFEQIVLLREQRQFARVIGAAGRWHPAKDYANLIAALAPICKANSALCLKIAGRDVNTQNVELMALLKRYEFPKEQCMLLDEVSDMESFYQGIDVFVLPSKTEGFPNVLVEAMSYALPCITTDVGDAAYILSKPEWVVAPQSPKDLQTAIERMINVHQTVRQTIANDNQGRVLAEFSIGDISQRYLKVYQQAGIQG